MLPCNAATCQKQRDSDFKGTDRRRQFAEFQLSRVKLQEWQREVRSGSLCSYMDGREEVGSGLLHSFMNGREEVGSGPPSLAHWARAQIDSLLVCCW